MTILSRETLLAIDLGLSTGLALYGADGRLAWYRSHNYGSAARLRRGAYALLSDTPGLVWLVIEGGGNLADIWEHAAAQQGISVRRISAEIWREQLLYVRERRSGAQAKQHADALARRVIEWSGAARPTALRHDTAEAILIGLWGVLELGWLPALPPEVRR
jgi:hypothetical protein